jgi:large conductance mechanosensitive channel
VSLLKEFRDFINRGNVVDLAVAVVIGAAFTAVVNSLVNDILLQLIAVIFGKPDFSDLTFTVNDAVIRYGSFITAVISFVLIAAAVFVVVKAYNHLKDMGPTGTPTDEEPPPSAEDLLAEIRDLLAAQGPGAPGTSGNPQQF